MNCCLFLVALPELRSLRLSCQLKPKCFLEKERTFYYLSLLQLWYLDWGSLFNIMLACHYCWAPWFSCKPKLGKICNFFFLFFFTLWIAAFIMLYCLPFFSVFWFPIYLSWFLHPPFFVPTWSLPSLVTIYIVHPILYNLYPW